VRVGIVGCGQVTREVHVPNLRRLEGEGLAQLCGVTDPDARAAAECGARMAARVDELLGWDLDGVIVASPSGLHASHAGAVLRAGKGLYLEKPLAHSLPAAEELAALDHGRASMAFNYRYHPWHLLAFGRWRGRVQRVRSEFSIAPRALSEWRTKRALGGGVLLDLAVHHVDLALRLFDRDVIAVRRELRSVRYEEDEAEIEIEFVGGGRYQGRFSYQASERDVFRIEAPGTMEIHRYAPFRFPIWPLSDWWQYQTERRAAPWREASFGKALRAWVLALRGEGEFPAPLREGLRAQRILEWP
jgi:myo-inositol 2-dehydrogenase / D-chiro-inositol 1-dehydrogenase